MAESKGAETDEKKETVDDLLQSNKFVGLSARERMKVLQQKQSELEKEIDTLLLSIPQEFRNMKQRPSYIDSQGFPRSDIDVWHIGTVRNKVAPLQNDHIKIMNVIEKTLIEIFSSNKKENDKNKNDDSKTNTNKQNSNDKNDNNDKTEEKGNGNENKNENENTNGNENNDGRQVTPYALKPFYLVDKIFYGSPAQEAGLKSGDLVIQFGSMVNENKSPQLLQEIVKSSVNKPIPVTIKRNPEGILGLQLTPKQWSGRGLLGCHLTPYEEK